VTLSVIGVVFAFVAGLLAVPGGPSTANSLLAAAMACASSALLLRIIRRGTVCLTALAATSALTATAAAGGVAWSLPVTATGVAMAGLSLAAVGVAPRMSIAATGLTPPLSAEQPLDDETTRALAAHQILTGLVVGSAGATALGAAVVVGRCVHDNIAWPKGALFAAVVGLAMVLRARTHVDRRRREALAICGMAALAASGARVVVSAPGQANWICLVATALCVGALSGAFAPATNPLARRAVDVLEYLALAAVVPLACWIGGLYGAVRGVSLP
jgi:type VII secretion integral membrane protein EccD